MKRNFPYRFSIFTFASIFAASFVFEASFDGSYGLLLEKKLSSEEIEYFDLIKGIFSVFSLVILSFAVNFFSSSSILMFFLIIFLANMPAGNFIAHYSDSFYRYLVSSSAVYSFFLVSLYSAVSYGRISKKNACALFLLAWLAGDLSGVLFNSSSFAELKRGSAVSAIFLDSALIILLLAAASLVREPAEDRKVFKANFSILAQKTILENLTAFTISYLFTGLFPGGGLFGEIENLEESTSFFLKFSHKYLTLGIILSWVPLFLLSKKINYYTIIPLGVAGFSFLCFFFDPKSLFLTSSAFVCLALGFASAILVVLEKFDPPYLKRALILFFSFACAGSYVGTVARVKIKSENGISGLIFSVGCVSVIFLIYYLKVYTDKKLYLTRFCEGNLTK